MADDKLVTLASRLHARTVAGKLAWEKTGDTGVFQTTLPGYSVLLLVKDGRDGNDDYVIKIVDLEGDVIDEFADVDIARNLPAGEAKHAFYRMMKETYELARRNAMGIDRAVDSILERLGEEDDDDSPF